MGGSEEKPGWEIVGLLLGAALFFGYGAFSVTELGVLRLLCAGPVMVVSFLVFVYLLLLQVGFWDEKAPANPEEAKEQLREILLESGFSEEEVEELLQD